jgi:uncharacterized protein YecT (DUF1311 family)
VIRQYFAPLNRGQTFMTKRIAIRPSRLRWLALVVLLICMVPPLRAEDQPPIKASFDCLNAASITEKAICSSWDIGFADRIQAQVYKILLERVDKLTRERIQKDQLEWLKQRDKVYGLTYRKLSSRIPKPVHLDWKLENSLLNAINSQTAALITALAELPAEKLRLDTSLPTKYPQDYRRLFGTWKIIAVINNGVHDSGYPVVAESNLGKVIRMEEPQCPSAGRAMDEVDVFQWYGDQYRRPPKKFGFKNYKKVIRIKCSISQRGPDDLTGAEYLFFNDYLMAEGENIWLRIESPTK